jgi:hypothetical protein
MAGSRRITQLSCGSKGLEPRPSENRLSNVQYMKCSARIDNLKIVLLTVGHLPTHHHREMD